MHDHTCGIALSREGIQYKPAPVSLLVTRSDLPFSVGEATHPEAAVTVLAYSAPGKATLPVATLVATGDTADTYVCVDLAEKPSPDADRAVEIATLERFYGLVLREEGQAHYCIADPLHACTPKTSTLSQADVLRELVARREHAIQSEPAGHDEKPWQVVTLSSTGQHSLDDEVRVRIANADGPMRGATVFFHKAPHSGCKAESGADGLAVCRLVDQHGDDDGDDDGDEDNEGTKLLVTFPGEIGALRTLVPITLVMKK